MAGQDGQLRFLCEVNEARSELINRTARPVGCDGDVESCFDPIEEFTHGGGSAPTARPAHRAHAEVTRDQSEPHPVLACAGQNKDSAAASRITPQEGGGDGQNAVVPKCVDGGTGRRCGEEAVRVFDPDAQGGEENPEYYGTGQRGGTLQESGADGLRGHGNKNRKARGSRQASSQALIFRRRRGY